MNILDSIVDGALALTSRRESDALIGAAVRYMRTGEEPSLTGNAAAMWIAVKPVLKKSKTLGENASKGKGKTEDKPSSKTEDKPSSKTEDKPSSKTASKRATEQVSSSSSYSFSNSLSGQGDLRDALPEPPTLDEVRDYFACNCLRGDPAEFFDHFESQGWVRANGLPIADWRAQARQWSRKQVEFDQAKPADARAPEAPLPKADNAVDWEAELERMEGEGAWNA